MINEQPINREILRHRIREPQILVQDATRVKKRNVKKKFMLISTLGAPALVKEIKRGSFKLKFFFFFLLLKY